MNYKNRIIGTGEEQVEQILFNPRNWRVHPLYQQDALKGVLEEVGWIQQVIINKQTGHLIDGHLRCQLAAREGQETVPVLYVDVTEDEEKLLIATIDPIAGMAATDKEMLEELFNEIKTDNERVEELIKEIKNREGILDGLPTLDELEDESGEFDEPAFDPEIKIKVTPLTFEKYEELMEQMPGDTEAERFDALISGYVA